MCQDLLPMDNTRQFTGKAVLYAEARPLYPAPLLDYLVQEEGLGPGCEVVDAGSGTGLFAGQLLQTGCRVFGVEPNAEMRALAEKLFEGEERFVSVAATAENTTLAPHSIDLVTAAQSFHWFDPEAFRRECQRLLRPGKRALLVWNSRCADHPAVVASGAVCQKFCPNFRGFSGGFNHNQKAIATFFRGPFRQLRFDHPLCYTQEAFVARMLSASYAPLPGEAQYEPFICALRALFDAYADASTLVLPCETIAYTGSIGPHDS